MFESKNIVFAGTPDFAAYHLNSLIDSGYQPTMVLTQPDRASGRGRKMTPSAVKILAENNNIPVFQPEKFDENSRQFLMAQERPDLLIVVAYGLLLPQWVLDWARYGAINVHASLLPRWRGAAPIQRAIEAGDMETGVGIMQMDIGLDTGDVWREEKVPITETTSAETLHDALQITGASALVETLPVIFSQKSSPVPQEKEGVTYAKKLSKKEAKINWEESAEVICRKIRAFNPVPVAHSETKSGDRFRFYAAAASSSESCGKAVGTVVAESKEGIVVLCGDGVVCITELQEVGKKRLLVNDFLNGKSLLGEQFV